MTPEEKAYEAATVLDATHDFRDREAVIARQGIAEVLDGVRPWTIATDRAVRLLKKRIAADARHEAWVNKLCADIGEGDPSR